MEERDSSRIIIVGAGLAGLVAGRILQDAGHQITLLDKGARPGGRLATRHLFLGEGKRATFDHGAQYFTVREDPFRRLVSRWLEEGVVEQWSNGFATPDASAYQDGHPRYRGQPAMAALPRWLARPLDVRLETTVTAVTYAERWRVATASGQQYQADTLIMTPPVPQTLALLAEGQVTLPEAAGQALARIDYDPCFAVMAVLDGPSAIPTPGGLWPGSQAISWMADNQQKGISQLPAVTIHGSPEFSNSHFDDDPDDVARRLLDEAGGWLGSRVITYRVKRWRYSIPVHMHHEPYLAVDVPGPILFAGDAFAGPRVEGATLSGLAAAGAVLESG